MQSKDLIKINLDNSMGMVLPLVEDMKDAPTTFPTKHGGCHPLWVLGHLAYSEGTLIQEFMLDEPNPLAEWKDIFDSGTEPVDDISKYPPFDEVLARCQEARRGTLELLETYSEDDLDRPSKNPPADYKQFFGAYRLCFFMIPNHWLMHRAHICDARRSAGKERFGP